MFMLPSCLNFCIQSSLGSEKQHRNVQSSSIQLCTLMNIMRMINFSSSRDWTLPSCKGRSSSKADCHRFTEPECVEESEEGTAMYKAGPYH